MSLNKFTSQLNKNDWANARFNSLVLDNNLDMKNSNINQVNEINGVPFSGIVNSAKSKIIWRPGALFPKVENIYRDWSGLISVKSAILELSGAVEIYCDNSLGALVIDSDTDFQGNCELVGRPDTTNPNVTIQDNIILSNLCSVSGLTLTGNFSTVPLVWTISNPALLMYKGASLKYDAPTSVPFIRLQNSDTLAILLDTTCNIDNSNSVGSAVIELKDTSSMFILGVDGSNIQNDTITSMGGAVLDLVFDASVSQATFVGTVGPVNRILLDQAVGVGYDDTKVAPPLGSTNVQGALDALKATGGDVSFAGAAPAVSELAVFAAIDGKSIQASSVAGAVCNGDLDMKSNDVKSVDAFDSKSAVIASLTYPAADGNAGAKLVSDGAGTLSFSNKEYMLANDLSNTISVPDSTNFQLNNWTSYSSLGGISIVGSQDFKVSTPGLYLVTYGVQWNTVANGQRNIGIGLNGVASTFLGRMTIDSNATQVVGPNMCSSAQLLLAANDTVSIFVYQSSGAPINVFASNLEISKL